ncbi:MAG: flagellar export chaperone FliS [Bryobacteraceae bacterium]
MANQFQQAYLEGEVLQADPLHLVRLLYRAAVDAVAKARVHIRAKEIAARSRQITRAMEILGELAQSLDLEGGGDLARRLLELYDYMGRRLQEANFQQADEPLAEVERLLVTLLDGWERCEPPQAVAPSLVDTGAEGGRIFTA